MASAATQLANLQALPEQNSLIEEIRSTLSFTPKKVFSPNGAYTVIYEQDDYYLSNDIWNCEHFLNLEQFKNQKNARWVNKQKYTANFTFPNENLSLEAKFVFHQMLFSEQWALSAAFSTTRSALSRLRKFVSEYYPQISSFSQMQTNEFKEHYKSYLVENGLKWKYRAESENREHYTTTFSIVSIMNNHLQRIIRDRFFSSITTDLWKEDYWSIKYFKRYGLDTSRSSGVQTITFDDVKNEAFKELIKRYLREKLMTHTLAWGTAHGKSVYLKRFLNYISDTHPEWKDLAKLSRKDMLLYLEDLSAHIVSVKQNHRKDVNVAAYPRTMLSQIRTFLLDIQILGYQEAPTTPAVQLIRSDDTKGYTSEVKSKIKYIPDDVLKQFFEHIADLPEKYLPIVLTMYYTGLRISDTLELKQDCLVQIDGQYWIEAYIRKTKTLDHRCPITNDFAEVMRSYIEEAKKISNDDNNPERFIFVNYRGSRKGNTYSQTAVTTALNQYAKRNNILDANGEIYKFRNHAFRHTFSVKMINEGADILTVMQLLAHATPKMTMAYAKLLDKTRRETFEKVMRSGVFTFTDSEGSEIVYKEDVPEDILTNLWQVHKLNALDTPYGTCLQRKNGNCSYAKNPPCLTCNEGKPCKDLCVGAFEGDSEKYAILINSTERLAKLAKQHNREDMREENEYLLHLLQEIKKTIDQGGIIYGRQERLVGAL